VGKKEHLPACKAGPDDDSDSVAIVAQRCFPLRRQHAGSFESPPNASTEGLISEKPKSASSSIADARRMGIFYSDSKKLSSRGTLSLVLAQLSAPATSLVSLHTRALRKAPSCVSSSNRDHNTPTPHGTFSQFVRTHYLCKRYSFPNFKPRPPRLKSIVQVPSCRHLGMRREIIAPKEI
jgi:hypothetical protein